eukprot:828038-Rhodomonas_salina.2
MAKTLEKDRFKRLGYLGAVSLRCLRALILRNALLTGCIAGGDHEAPLAFDEIGGPSLTLLPPRSDPTLQRSSLCARLCVCVSTHSLLLGRGAYSRGYYRHCMYGLDPSSKPTVDQMQAWEEEDKMFGDPKGGGGGGGDDDEDEEGGEKGRVPFRRSGRGCACCDRMQRRAQHRWCGADAEFAGRGCWGQRCHSRDAN